jgi:hypothetical protein
MNSEEWVDREDEIQRADRIRRLEWLVQLAPNNGIWLFHGGSLTKSLFEEAKYCFVYGQFFASTMLGLSFLEHSLASLLYGTGRNDLERANISNLVKEALNMGWITQDEFEMIEKARALRNRITHFRSPGDEDRIEFVSVNEQNPFYNVVEEDARSIMQLMMHFLSRFSERI